MDVHIGNSGHLNSSVSSKMVPIIQRLSRLALKTFSHMHDNSFNENLSELRIMASQVTASDVKLNSSLVPGSVDWWRPNSAPVTYVSIVDAPIYTMGIFIIHKDCRIPIHDHPGMFGIIKVLHGKLVMQSYTPIDGHGKMNSKTAIVPVLKLAPKMVDSNSEACCLMPIEGNFHELRSVDGPAAFLDILAPPYSEGRRDCSYYVEKCDTSKGKSEVFLVQVSHASEYWNDVAPYEGPEIIH